jgi:type IV pilus biogenesis protein CpaD/CtpE
MMRGRVAIALAATALLAACASSPPRATRTEFEDIPVPKGLSYQAGDSTVIETPNVKAGRHVYRGRVELESLATAIRSTLEANGWRHVSTSKTAQHGTTQVYEKEGDSLQVLLWEGLWFTYAEYATGRVVKRAK